MKQFFWQYSNIWYGLALLGTLLMVRMYHTGSVAFGFLFWNLFLAVIPLCFSHWLTSRKRASVASWVAALLWLLFFPNAAYLFTDLVHLTDRGGLLYWLDIVILVLSAIYGIAIGMLSLRQMEGWYGRWATGAWRPLITLSLLFLCGYGIYLGRMERWNSWDIIVRPVGLLRAMAYHALHPYRCFEVWMMSALFGISLYVLYLLFEKRLGTVTVVNSGSDAGC